MIILCQTANLKVFSNAQKTSEIILVYLKKYRKHKYSLKINPDDAYVLNYLAYSWLERDYKIDEAMEMLEKAYAPE